MKTQPNWWIGVIIYLIYNGIIFSIWAAVGADYNNMVGSEVIFKSLVLPLALGAIFLIAMLSWLGWWRPVITEDRRGGPSWVLWIVLAIMLGFIVINVSATSWSAIAAGHLLLLVAGAILVGFNEEALTRGILVVGWRGSTSNEVWVWFWASLLFGLLHLPNAFFGPGLAVSGVQVIFAFLAGSGFYILRRLSGTLIIPMVLHGAWDFSTFSHQASGADLAPLTPLFQFGTYLISIILVIVVLRAGRRSSEQ